MRTASGLACVPQPNEGRFARATFSRAPDTQISRRARRRDTSYFCDIMNPLQVKPHLNGKRCTVTECASGNCISCLADERVSGPHAWRFVKLR